MKVPVKIKLPDDLHVAKLLSESEDHVVLEVTKHNAAAFSLIEEGDQFFTIAFIRDVKGTAKPWRPWRREPSQ